LLIEEIEAHERTDRALQEAKEQADAANLAKSRYLTGISHELRSPLNAILGYAQLLEKDPTIPEQRRDALSVIRHSSEHLADLIEGLLDISKIEAGRLDLHQDPVRIQNLLEQLVQMFQMQAQTKGLSFYFECKDRLPEWVKADEKRLRQILINLLSNAVKYTPGGSIKFIIKYRSQVAEFIVQDTGEGIAADNLERIFRPFERLRNSSSTISGTGLGLTITRLLTEIMGGDISVVSEVGKGSQFKVSLMLSDISHQQAVAAQNSPAKILLAYKGDKRQLVVVDDDISHRNMMNAILLPLGFSVMDFSHPQELLTALTDSPQFAVDLFLLDVSLPGMDGWRLAKELRDRGYFQPIVMVSADASEGKNIYMLGDTEEPPLHQAYVIKPLRTQLLFDHLGRLLNLQWLYQAPISPSPAPSPAKIPQLIATDQQKAAVDQQKVFDNQKEIVEKQKLAMQSADLDELARLAAIGHKRGVVQKIQSLLEERQLNKFEQGLLNNLLKMAKEFQFDTLLHALDVHAALSEKP
jgi:nitrogen-specific signal transduction histidine kinase/DNA-binding response OmpR family regulator